MMCRLCFLLFAPVVCTVASERSPLVATERSPHVSRSDLISNLEAVASSVPADPMTKTAWQNLLTASPCHKFSFAFASPISCIVLIAIAVLTASTRNYFTDIIAKIADDIGKLSCTSSDIAKAAQKSLLDKVNNDPQFIAANTLFQNYITAFGGGIIGFHIVVIQLFHCCSIMKRSRAAHICGISFITLGAMIFLLAGLLIM